MFWKLPVHVVMQSHLSWYPVQTGPPTEQQRKGETNNNKIETFSIQAVLEHMYRYNIRTFIIIVILIVIIIK